MTSVLISLAGVFGLAAYRAVGVGKYSTSVLLGAASVAAATATALIRRRGGADRRRREVPLGDFRERRYWLKDRR